MAESKAGWQEGFRAGRYQDTSLPSRPRLGGSVPDRSSLSHTLSQGGAQQQRLRTSLVTQTSLDKSQGGERNSAIPRFPFPPRTRWPLPGLGHPRASLQSRAERLSSPLQGACRA